ncbi:MAG: 3-ketoacyl-ACP reductase [Massiliimalia sp.]|jgi:3-oxoacyl-[acyl-carrier protein] reductase
MKVALVTGSSRGIGLGIGKQLTKGGYHVVFSATSEDGGDVLNRLKAEGIQGDYLKLDISSKEDRQKALQELIGRYGRIDVLVNNAGVAPKVRLDVLETTEESFERLMKINLEGTFFMCQLFANEMVRLKQENQLEDYHPRLINISSISAYTASVSRGEYCISKAGISMCTQLFAKRLAEYGIPVFEIRPGIILTDMTAGVREKYEAMIAQGLTPIQRFGMPEDVAECVSAAVSGKLDFATGQVLNADGGFHIRTL